MSHKYKDTVFLIYLYLIGATGYKMVITLTVETNFAISEAFVSRMVLATFWTVELESSLKM